MYNVNSLCLTKIIRSEFSRERCNLESSIGSVKDELRTAKARLDCESKWKDTAENIHRKLLEEKSELTAKSVSNVNHLELMLTPHITLTPNNYETFFTPPKFPFVNIRE